ncbi:MAG: hypothetical protein E7Z84_07525 [Methanosphaera stadtmanae]|nr:hypothetical protein [Methanosphaera stadtmanae]
MDHINKGSQSPVITKSSSVKFSVPVKTKSTCSSLTYFGTSYGLQRKIDVENSILEVMFELLKKKLLSHVRTSIDVPSNNFSVQFEVLMKTLDSIIKKPSKSAKYLLKILRNYNPLKILLNLRDGLAKNNIRVYTATSNAFILKESFNLPYNPVWGLAAEDRNESGVLLIFISETIPNILEAVIHIYAKQIAGYDNKICTIFESLVNAQEVDDLLPVPERMIWQLNNSSYSEKLTYIQNTRSVVKDIHKCKNLSTEQINYLAAMADYIKIYSEYLLIEKQRYLDYLLQCAQTGYQPTKTNHLEEEFCRIVGWATLDPEGLSTLKVFSTCLTEAITGTQVKINSPYTACIVYLFSCFWKACRRIAWLELFSALVSMNPCFLPESDQVSSINL